jgi:arsenite methyltransferase
MEKPMTDQLLDSVRSKYGAVAESTLSNDHAGVKAVAEAFGYSEEELTSIPADANMGLSCGNPTAIASIRPGEIVVDLGSGGGLDVFLASPLVGPEGKAIGIDMTPSMIERARANAVSGGYQNVEFHLSTIDKIPLPDASVDCIISNCVINLAPDKPLVFREMARVLRPGGRIAISDIALKGELPPEVATSMAAYVGCIGGAILMDDYREGFLKPLALGAWTFVSGSPTAKARESIALISTIYSVRGFHTPGRRVTVPTSSSNIPSVFAIQEVGIGESGWQQLPIAAFGFIEDEQGVT